MFIRQVVLTFLVILLGVSVSVIAEVPQLINYQGRLTNSGGEPVDGAQLIKFKIYGSAGGDDSLWWSGFQAVDVDNGLFNYQLGAVNPLPDDIFSTGTDRWLGITVGEDPEIATRTKITSMAYAYQALRSDTSGYATDIADNIVTEPKIAPEAVGSDELQDDAVVSAIIAPDAVHSYHIVDGEIQFGDIGQNGATANQVMKWNGSAWAAADDETGAGGDITAVEAGDGLTGGGTTGDVSLSVATDGINSLMLADDAVTAGKIAGDAVDSTKIISGGISFSDIGQNGASTNWVMKWDGAQWIAAFDDNYSGSGWRDYGSLIKTTYNGDSVGIGLNTNYIDAKFHVHGDVKVGIIGYASDVIFRGSEDSSRFYWCGDKAALRIGHDDLGLGWELDSIGNFSFSAGHRARAMGTGSAAFGYYTTARGNYSLAQGNVTEASGGYSIAMGRYVTAGPANYTVAIGHGSAPGSPLQNNIENSLMVGFDKATPVLFVDTGNVGISTTTPNSRLHVGGSIGHKVTTISTDPYYITDEDNVLLVSYFFWTGSLYLPNATGRSGRVYTIKNIGASSSVNVYPQATQSIDGGSVYSLADLDFVVLVCDGSNWWVIGN
jgi:hypothetical protein